MAATGTPAQQTEETPWHAALPAPKLKANTISRTEVIQWLPSKPAPLDFVLVDVRRADHEGGTISGSINLPAQSFYPSIPTVYAIFKQANVKKVIFYCGSSKGRGTRAGGWLADYLAEHDSTGMQSLVLEGGIKGWVTAGEEWLRRGGLEEVGGALAKSLKP
ncbi:conserved hypothetical protein [Uncinocarpus reesii 1704]|uniref:Rhodanese domain-containing protein n=1 Tax=Uncinocarpus reesii (strain UAMH 1704) TaxID=336963 RepID=C4JHQ2_UNCRE|nr:uncharacterized protein UREG_02738 [Uncinocarpus reesii 1704]EEP77889.1 conserved hypothetical protein [Uncinocarpus reesii 1704]